MLRTFTTVLTLSFFQLCFSQDIDESFLVLEDSLFLHEEMDDLYAFSDSETTCEIGCSFITPPKFIGADCTIPELAQEYFDQLDLTYEETYCFITFMITKEGNLIDPKVMVSAGDSIDYHCLEFIKTLTAWEPGSLEGQKVDATLAQRFNFHPKKDSSDELPVSTIKP